jgi:hypothetical protein
VHHAKNEELLAPTVFLVIFGKELQLHQNNISKRRRRGKRNEKGGGEEEEGKRKNKIKMEGVAMERSQF